MKEKMWAECPDKWSFIVNTMTKDDIDNIVANFFKSSELDRFMDDTKISMGDVSPEPWKSCIALLMRKASAIMWKNSSKEAVNSLLRIMRELSIVRIEMPNGISYTAKEIVDAWKQANQKEGE